MTALLVAQRFATITFAVSIFFLSRNDVLATTERRLGTIRSYVLPPKIKLFDIVRPFIERMVFTPYEARSSKGKYNCLKV